MALQLQITLLNCHLKTVLPYSQAEEQCITKEDHNQARPRSTMSDCSFNPERVVLATSFTDLLYFSLLMPLKQVPPPSQPLKLF
jgi:hypothetical protein